MRIFLNSGERRMNFSDVLDDVSRAAGVDIDFEPKRARPRSVRASRLDKISEIAREIRMSALSSLLESYLEHHRERKVQRVRRTADPQAVAAELAITEQMTSAELARLRRRFALANHPDRVAREERDVATRRMMVANMLIDGAIKRRIGA